MRPRTRLPRLPRIAVTLGAVSLVAAVVACGDAGPSEQTGSSPEAVIGPGQDAGPTCPAGQTLQCAPNHGACMCTKTGIVGKGDVTDAGACISNVGIPTALASQGCTFGYQDGSITVWPCPVGVTVPSDISPDGDPICAETDAGPSQPPPDSPPCDAVGTCSAPACGTVAEPILPGCAPPLRAGWEYVVDFEVDPGLSGIGAACGGGCGHVAWIQP